MSETTGKQWELACQDQNDKNVEDHSPKDLLVSSHNTTSTLGWLYVRKTLANSNLWCLDIVWANVLLLFFCYFAELLWMTPIFSLLFGSIKKIITPTVPILYSSFWTGKKLLWRNYFSFLIWKKISVYSHPHLDSASNQRLESFVTFHGPSMGEVRYFTHVLRH